MRNQRLHILRHSLGLDDTGRGTMYRNHFCASPGHHDWDDLMALCEEGLMVDLGARGQMTGDDNLLMVTDKGKAVASKPDPLPPVSRGRRRYRYWRDLSDAWPDISFGRFLTDPIFDEHRRAALATP